MIDVSIIVLTFNQELFVEQCFNSILEQKFNGSLEIVICDDCSIDSTYTILENLCYGIEYIKLFKSKTNLGLSKNYQNAILKATGRYIAYLEGDDYWTDPLKIQKQFDGLEVNSDYSLAFHDFVYIDKSSTLISDFNHRKNKLRVNRSVSDMISGCLIHQNTIMLRNNFQNLPIWFFLAKNHDTWLLAYLSNWGPALYVECEPLYYRMVNNSLWSSLSPLKKHFNGLITTLVIFPIAPVKFYPVLLRKLGSKVFQIIKISLK